MDPLPWMPILMYHRVLPRGSADPDDPYSTPIEMIESHLDWLGQRGFAPVPLDLALQPPQQGEGRRFAVTFDDGYGDFLELALPLLRRRGVPATVFAVSNAVGGRSHWDRGAPLLSAAGLRELQSEGIFVGSHGRTHRRLAGLPHAELESEVAGSKQDLEELLGAPVRHFAYPYHSLDGMAMEAVRQAGFEGAAGGNENAHQPFNLHRIDGAGIGRPRLGLYFHGLHRRTRGWPLPHALRRLGRTRR